MVEIIEPMNCDRRDKATLLAHRNRPKDNRDTWVWSDGWVTSRIGGRRFGWKPEVDVEVFIAFNGMPAPTEASYQNIETESDYDHRTE